MSNEFNGVSNVNAITHEQSSDVTVITHEQHLEVERREEERWMLYYLEKARSKFAGDITISEAIERLKQRK